MKITTAMCKEFIVSQLRERENEFIHSYRLTDGGDPEEIRADLRKLLDVSKWKRQEKFKDLDGGTIRVFRPVGRLDNIECLNMVEVIERKEDGHLSLEWEIG